jgi:hypothetical protein
MFPGWWRREIAATQLAHFGTLDIESGHVTKKRPVKNTKMERPKLKTSAFWH